MPRMQVYLPEELYREVKAHNLPASELLQQAIVDELTRRRLLGEAERHLRELEEEVGEPATAERERAEIIARRLSRRPGQGAGRLR